MRFRDPIIVAHRGYASKYPENTIEACQAAVDAGARWVEVDVQMHGCDPVLAHDFPVGNEPSLSEFADWLAAHPEVTALVDLKAESLIHYGREEVVQSVIDAMRGNWHPISFDYGALKLAVELGSPAPGWTICEFNPRIAQKASDLGARWLIINQIFVPAEGLPSGPWEWMSYEVATPDQARSLMERGVHWLETMRFSDIAEGLNNGT